MQIRDLTCNQSWFTCKPPWAPWRRMSISIMRIYPSLRGGSTFTLFVTISSPFTCELLSLSFRYTLREWNNRSQKGKPGSHLVNRLLYITLYSLFIVNGQAAIVFTFLFDIIFHCKLIFCRVYVKYLSLSSLFLDYPTVFFTFSATRTEWSLIRNCNFSLNVSCVVVVVVYYNCCRCRSI